MSGEERESQLSAMFDGELSSAECELVARRLSRDENLRRSWGHYALIGAVMRGEPTAARLAARVRAGLATPATEGSAKALPEAAVAKADARRTWTSPRWVWPLGATGVAAGLAWVALFGIGTESPVDPSGLADPLVAEAIVDQVVFAPGPLRVAQGATLRPAPPVRTERGPSEPESYVTPQGSGSGGPAMAVDPQLAQFVMAHSAVTPPMVRHGALSAVVAPESSSSRSAASVGERAAEVAR